MQAHMISEQNITVFFNDKIYTLNYTDPHFNDVANQLRQGNYADAVAEIDKATALTKHFGADLQIQHGTLAIDGITLPDCLAKRLAKMRDEGYDLKPMKAFMANLMKNPTHHAIKELLDFLENSDLPITDDGHFLAYKRVNANYKDVYSNSIDNSVGQEVSMPRGAVDDNRNSTCSHGLHFASLNYLQHFSGPRLMLLKINPADVVSIPADYNDSKGRCCRYQVIKELPMPAHFTELKDTWSAVWGYDSDEDEY